ncbi:MAG: hypothetical protein SWH78_18060, partial [Thermodesulfobacteriota bacterium]|nr:hypothetical protein [Thermodesulfobacteriota bacterium]
MNLRDMKIGVTGLFFGAIFFVVAVILFFTTFSLNKVRDNSELVRDESLPYAILADNMSFETLEVLAVLLYA